jgi:dynein heavy chain
VVECISSKAKLTSELLDSIKAAGTLKQGGLTAWVETVTAMKTLVVRADSALNMANSKLCQLWRSSGALAPYSKTAAIIFQMVLLLPRLNGRYLCFDLCLQCYRETVLSEQSVASTNADYGPVLKGFVRQIYQRVAPRLLEMDRQVFLFMLGVAIGLYQNEEEKVEGGTKRFKSDRSTFESIAEFLSVPVPSLYTDALDSWFKQATLSAEQQQRKANSFELNLGKRFPALLEGGTHTPWHEICHDNFDAILRHRVDWNLWRDNKRSANRSLPHAYDNKLRPLNRMAITATLNPHLFLGAADDMVRTLLGPCVSGLDTPFNLGKELQEDQLRTVALLEGMCASDGVAAIGTLARQEGVQMTVFSMHQSNASSEFEKDLERALVLGSWFVVTGAHQNSVAIAELRHFIETHASQAHPQFRFWVTASQAKAVCTPPGVLYELAFQPENMRFKTNLLRTLTMLSDEVLNTSQRSEWLALLHNVCFLHCVLVGRRKFGTVGANRHYSFCEQDRLDVLQFAVSEYTHNQGSRVGAVRSFFSLVYGRHISHKQDRTALMALINSWLCSASIKPGFEFKFDLPVPVYAQPTFYSTPPTLFRKSDSKWTVQPPRHLEMRETLRYLEGYPGLTEDRLAETCALNSWLRRDATEDRHFVKWVRSLFSVLKPATPSTTDKIDLHSTPLVTAGASSKGDIRTAHLLERLDTLIKRVPAKVPRRVAAAQGTLTGKQHSVHIHSLEDPIWRVVEAEVSQLNELLRSVRQDVANMKEALLGNMAITPVMFVSMQQILKKHVPDLWLAQSWVPAQQIGDVLGHWVDELETRVKELGHLAHLGMKTPSIFLGGLFNPRALLMALCQREITAAHPKPTLRCEITVRDKDHLREPPADGIFVHNVALEGCGWDMSSQAAGLKDIIVLDKTTSKRTVLPVLHLTYAPMPEVPLGRGGSKVEIAASPKKRPGEPTVTNFSCPVYTTAKRSQTDEDALIFNIEMPCEDSPLAMKWVSRGICATLR